MKHLIITAVLGLALAAPAWGQDSSANTSNNQNTSNSSSDTASNAQSLNQGVQATVNQLSSGEVRYSGEFTQDVRSQVPLSVVGYGSFSQNNCQNSVGVGATSRVFSFVYNGPRGNPACEAAVRSDQFGRESQLAYAQGKPQEAELLRAMGVWETCNTSEQTRQACLRMGLVNAETVTDARGRSVAITMPSPRKNVSDARPVAQVGAPTVKPPQAMNDNEAALLHRVTATN